MDVKELEKQVLARWEIAADEVTEALSKRLTVAFLGPASSGKDSAIRALFGIDFGQIDPIPGSTDRVRVAALDSERRVLIVNAPGFGDLRDDVEREARSVLDSVDIAVYVINCDGGATIDERRDLDTLRKIGRPVLVCLNKIDLIRPHDRESFVNTTLAQLGVEHDDAVVTAFDPLPALSDTPIGVERTSSWVFRHLEEQGKSLLFAKHLRNKAAAADVVIQGAARRAAMAGALPVPGADVTAVTVVQVKLISDIAAIHGKRIDKDLALFIVGEALAGSSKGFIRWAVNALKVAGWIPGGQIVHVATSALGATVAGATTYGVGRAAVKFIQSDGRMSGDELRAIFDQEAFEWQKQKQLTDESEPKATS